MKLAAAFRRRTLRNASGNNVHFFNWVSSSGSILVSSTSTPELHREAVQGQAIVGSSKSWQLFTAKLGQLTTKSMNNPSRGSWDFFAIPPAGP